MTITLLLLGLLPSVLGGIPGLSAKIKQLIADVAGSAAAIIGSGSITAPSATTILAAWAGVIAALRSDPSLPASALNGIAQLEKAVQAALTEDAVAAQSVDWSKITLIQTV